MERLDFNTRFGGGAFRSLIAPNLLARLVVHSYDSNPLLLEDPETSARITAIGIGHMGAKMAQILARNVPVIDCHHLLFLPSAGSPDDLAAVIDAVRKSDLVFVLGGLEEPQQRTLMHGIWEGARESGVLSVAVVPDADHWRIDSDGEEDRSRLPFDCLLEASAASLSPPNAFLAHPKNHQSLTGYAMRHAVSTISTLILTQGIICVDFADVALILRSGVVGILGVGVGSGALRGRTAALLALNRLREQGAEVTDAKGIIACVHGSSDMRMEDFDEASLQIHENIDEDATIVIGMLTEEHLGTNLRVSILMVA